MADKPVRVRFAPSPTGKLHVGGARTAIYNWAFARANGGTFILRIDDTDPTRSTDENTADHLARHDAGWALTGTRVPRSAATSAPTPRPSASTLYKQAAQRLMGRAARPTPASARPKSSTADARRRPRAQRTPSRATSAPAATWTPQRPSAASTPASRYVLAHQGAPRPRRRHRVRRRRPRRRDLQRQGAWTTLIIFRSDGTPTYNFATVVRRRHDGHHPRHPRRRPPLQHPASDPRLRGPGRPPCPTFAHLSMILGADGKKLSKRHGAASVEEYRDAGYLPDAMVNFLALLGWSLDGETTIIAARRPVPPSSAWTASPRRTAIFDPRRSSTG